MKALLVLAAVAGVISEEAPLRTNKGLQQMVDNRNLFSPRMEYDEWTPLGRGDPLKNDPTYDYVPPVLERVHYWMDPSKRTPDPPSLDPGYLLGSSSRTEPTFTSQRATTPKLQHADSRLDAASLLDPFLKLVDVSKFGLNLASGTGNYYKQGTSSNRIHPMNYQRPPHHQYTNQRYRQPPLPPPQALQRPPYAMLVPPPLPPSTPSSATFATVTTTAEPVKTPVYQETTTMTVPTTKSDANVTTALPTTALTDAENVYKPVAIDMPEDETIRNDVAKIRQPNDDDGRETNFVKKPSPPKEPLQKPRPNERENNRKRPQQHPPQPLKVSKPSSQKEKWFATTVRPPTTTRMPDVLTTDPMFKHYKQPSEPIKGPFYLIIQGHSKVKTYGASKNPVNGLFASNEIRAEDGDDGRKRKVGKSGRWVSSLQEFRPDRKKRFEALPEATADTPAISELSAFDADALGGVFGKSEGGTSKKRYLPDPGMVFLRRRRDAKSRVGSTPETMITVSGKPTPSSDNVDVESFIALNDDYAPEDVVSLLLKEEGQGSGFGNFIVSIFGRSTKDEAA